MFMPCEHCVTGKFQLCPTHSMVCTCCSNPAQDKRPECIRRDAYRVCNSSKQTPSLGMVVLPVLSRGMKSDMQPALEPSPVQFCQKHATSMHVRSLQMQHRSITHRTWSHRQPVDIRGRDDYHQTARMPARAPSGA
jgi:hypothetical protein